MADVALIGLSATAIALGAAIRRAEPELAVAGFDPDKQAGSSAKKLGAVDETAASVAKAVSGARLVIVGAGMDAAADALAAIGECVGPETVVTDVCPLKAPVMEWAAAHLPAGTGFVGGHPIARERRDDGTLSFEGGAYCIVPGPGADDDAVDAVVGLAATAGAAPFFVDAAEHDSFMIAAEYLPRLAAGSALDTAAASPALRDIKRVGEETLRNAAGLAGIDPVELAAVQSASTASLRSWLDQLIGRLGQLRDALDGAPGPLDELAALARAAAEERAQRLAAEETPRIERPSTSGLLLGDWLDRRMRGRG